MKTDYVEVAKLLRPHGLAGNLHAEVYVDPAMLLSLPLYVNNNKVLLNVVSSAKNRFITKIVGVDSITEAQAFVNQVVVVKRADLPSDTIYTYDLVGARVQIGGKAQELQVVEVYNFGSGFILDCGSELIHWNNVVSFNKAESLIVVKD